MENKRNIIEPKVLKGFRDSMPSSEIPKRKLIGRLETVFSSYGFVPIDTPALEYKDVLLGKGGGETDKQVFAFQDNGKRDVALRFDLTVPFARFMALHLNELALPFKRYHINKVWRGENPQKGRYREFYQCDFDIVGIDSAEADFEILSLMHSSFSALGLRNYTFCVAHRGLFNAFLEHLGVQDRSIEILRCVDKLRKIGEDKVLEILIEETGDEEKAKAIISYITRKDGEKFLDTLDRLSELAGGEEEHTGRMRKIYSYLEAAGIADHFIFDPSITRGLDYYTGIVYETFLNDLPSFGSVCSGGRYNNLASLYTKENLPGVGSSIGLDRLLSALEELGSDAIGSSSSCDVMIFNEDMDMMSEYTKAAAYLRSKGFRVDVYLSKKKIQQQFRYVDFNHIPYTLSIRDGRYSLKNVEKRETTDFDSIEKAAEALKEICL